MKSCDVQASCAFQSQWAPHKKLLFFFRAARIDAKTRQRKIKRVKKFAKTKEKIQFRVIFMCCENGKKQHKMLVPQYVKYI